MSTHELPRRQAFQGRSLRTLGAIGWLAVSALVGSTSCAEIAGIKEARRDDSVTPKGGSGQGGAANRGGSAGTGTGGKASSGGNPATGGSTSPASGGASTGGNTSGADCDSNNDSPYCESTSTVTFCNDGTLETHSCSDVCQLFGQAAGACAETSETYSAYDLCHCDALLDSECGLGVLAYCECVEGGCTQEDLGNYYLSCYHDDPSGSAAILKCWATGTGYCADDVETCGS